MTQEIQGVWTQYGLVGLMIGSITTLLFVIVKWTLSTTRDILEQAADERKVWNALISDHRREIEASRNSLLLHDERAAERGRLVKEEHIEMIRQLNEITQALGRINGYKH